MSHDEGKTGKEINDVCVPEKILALAGEGGGLYLYRVDRNGARHFSWDPIWQVPDEDGNVPTKTVGWKAPEYPTVEDAISAAPRYWPLLAPVFVHQDFREIFWAQASTRLAEGHRSSAGDQACRDRWERACRRDRRGYN